jgi:hypothetical protein
MRKTLFTSRWFYSVFIDLWIKLMYMGMTTPEEKLASRIYEVGEDLG